MGMVMSCDPFKFWYLIHISGMIDASIIKVLFMQVIATCLCVCVCVSHLLAELIRFVFGTEDFLGLYLHCCMSTFCSRRRQLMMMMILSCVKNKDISSGFLQTLALEKFCHGLPCAINERPYRPVVVST